MRQKLNSVMLIDDNFDDNFFHEREIRKANPKNIVVINESGAKALDYLRKETSPKSELILLDINMPGMNGWEFLKEYEKLNVKTKGHTIVIMLTTSDNEDDRSKMKEFPFVSAYVTKPLTRDKVTQISSEYFSAA